MAQLARRLCRILLFHHEGGSGHHSLPADICGRREQNAPRQFYWHIVRLLLLYRGLAQDNQRVSQTQNNISDLSLSVRNIKRNQCCPITHQDCLKAFIIFQLEKSNGLALIIFCFFPVLPFASSF